MLVKLWRFLTMLLTALSLGTVLGHLLELPAKMNYAAPLWLVVSQTLYAKFGTVGAVFEVGAVVTSVVLVVLVRRRRPAFGWTALCALCLVLANAAYWVWLAPVNAVVATLTLETLPTNWTALRSQWEYAHAARAALQLAALCALLLSVLVETPNAWENRGLA